MACSEWETKVIKAYSDVHFDVTFAVNCAFDRIVPKTEPPGKPVPRWFAWWRWGRVELPVQTDPSKNVLQA